MFTAKHQKCGEYHKVERDDMGIFVECDNKIHYVTLIAVPNEEYTK